MGDQVTIESNHLYGTESDLINCGNGNCYGLKVTKNWLHSDNPESGGKPACLTYRCSSAAGADAEISYNYCWNSRTFVDFENDGGHAPANRVIVAHNTVDFKMGEPPVLVVQKTPGQQMSIAWWTDSGTWNGPNFEIRDNLFTRQKWYQVADTDTRLQGQIVLKNNMFWKWQLAKNWPAQDEYPNEWPGKDGAVGWQDMGAGNEFVMENCISKKNPQYAKKGTTPDQYYALKKQSGAIGSASDGTNIGAWQ